ncbi:MAG: hypothetical protein ACP5NX_04130 [Candidatus Bilamarchaeaceae archaeon]
MVSSDKILMYIPIGAAVLGALFCVLFQGGLFGILGGIIAGVGAVVAILFQKYGYTLFPYVTGAAKMSAYVKEDYKIPPSQDVVVKKGSNGLYYASVFLGMKIFESASEKSLDENVAYNQFFERAISNLKYVTKIGYILYVEDITEKRRTIETKKAEAQLRLSREREKAEPDVLKLDKYEREIGLWEMQLNKLTKGIKPMGVLMYAMTTSVGVSEEGAVASAKAQGRELKTLLDNALNVDSELLTAEQMLRCFDWEFALPTTPQELEEGI